MEISLEGHAWQLGDTLGSGGFGRVFEAVIEGENVAVKLVPKDPSADRELLFADNLADVPHVVQVRSVGETQDSWALVMPRADRSLREYMTDLDRPLTPPEALSILIDVADSLVSLAAEGIVHRDLKPENILLLDGRWCLSDFGISRYAEATTSVGTHRDDMTAPYAAPEQWRSQRATPATDVYALGVIAYELLQGDRPFTGMDKIALREQHLTQEPPQLSSSVDTPLRSIVDECLTKAPQARPDALRLRERLEAQADSERPEGGAAAIADAHLRHVREVSERARLASEAKLEEERRSDLADAAEASLRKIANRMRDLIVKHAPTVEPTWPLKLGQATLAIAAPHTVNSRQAGAFNLPFDVIAVSSIVADQSNIKNGSATYCGRKHSLWYCDAQVEGRYSWFETAFWKNPMLIRQGGFNAEDMYYPWAISAERLEAKKAVAPGANEYVVAWPFISLVDDALDEFIDRWSGWFALAQRGALQMPTTRPEHSGRIHGSYRG